MRRGGLQSYLTRNRFQYLSVLPALVLITMIAFYPLSYTIYLTFFKGSLARLKFVNIQNYIMMVTDEYFWESFRISFVYTAVSGFFTITLGIAVGVLTAQPEKGNKVFKYIMMMPWIVSYVVGGILWKWILNAEFGALNEMIRIFGLPRFNWIGRPTPAMVMIIVAGVWKMLPFSAILFYASIISMPVEIYESATTDGANTFQKFFHLTLPLLKPTFLVVTVVLTIQFYNFITLMMTITGGGPSRSTTVLPLYMWKTAFEYLRLGYGSVIALVLFLVNILLAVGYMQLIKTEALY